MNALQRWRYRLVVWLIDRPDALARRAEVESVLIGHAQRGSSPGPDECRVLALQLGVPAAVRKTPPAPVDAHGGLLDEVDRLTAWLQHIEGGDRPCTDESQLRQWAYEAVTLRRSAPC